MAIYKYHVSTSVMRDNMMLLADSEGAHSQHPQYTGITTQKRYLTSQKTAGSHLIWLGSPRQFKVLEHTYIYITIYHIICTIKIICHIIYIKLIL